MKRKKKENILVFCAHIDDHIFGPGATLAQYAREGKNVYVCIFSYSEASLAWLKKKVAIETVIKEIRNADKIIGVKRIFFLELHDRKIEQEVKEKKIIPRLKKLILKYRPGKIFTHSSMDPHADHRAVNKAVLEAVDKSRFKCDVFAFEEIWSPIRFGKRNMPKMYVDVSDTFHKKIEAIKAFESQKVTIWTLIWNVYAKAFMHGKHIHARWAEKFYKLR
jgi:LmbE family N-acetylglucosaminyl deacetylase